MVKNNQTIRRLLPTNCLSVFDHFVGMALKEFKSILTSQKSDTLTTAFSITMILLPRRPKQVSLETQKGISKNKTNLGMKSSRLAKTTHIYLNVKLFLKKHIPS